MKKTIIASLLLACICCVAFAQQSDNRIQLVRNATLKIHYAGQTLLIDPMLAEKGTEMSALGVNLNPRVHLTMPVGEVLDGVDFVLLTHAHIDHYDPAAKRLISKDTPWYVQPADYDSVAVKDHFRNTTIVKESVQVGGGASSGYVLKAEGQPTLYVMGDCVWNEATQKAVKEHRPDYIVVNSGGAILPPLSKADGPIIPNEAETMRIIDDCPENTRFIAVHMDAIDHCQTTREILRNEARHHGVDMNRLIIPEDGESIVL